MKILVISDTHGDTTAISAVLHRETDIDAVVHCGDVDDDCDYIAEQLPSVMPFVRVSGNNEWFAQHPFSVCRSLGGVRFYVTHGHIERVRRGHDGLLAAAKAKKCRVALYGHTHVAQITEEDGILMVNPGALRYPEESYAIVHIENGTPHAELLTL